MAQLHTPDAFRWFIEQQPSLGALIERFPSDWVDSDAQLKELLAKGGVSTVMQAAKDSRSHLERIVKSGVNPEVVKSSLPVLLRSRMMVLALKNYTLAAQTKSTGRVAFDEANAALLQPVLFEGPGLVRKPVDRMLYERVWPQVTQKTYLMPLVNKKGIYCFYTRELIRELVALIRGRPCVELAAGDGTLSRFLNQAGCAVTATDSYGWSAFIDYPAEVLKLNASEALRKFSPVVAVASWPDPDNGWESAVFQHKGLETYIVLGSEISGVTGNPKTYAAAAGWSLERRPDLGRLILPEEQKNSVLVFTKR